MMKIVATNVVASRPPNGDQLQRNCQFCLYRFVNLLVQNPFTGGEKLDNILQNGLSVYLLVAWPGEHSVTFMGRHF